jgi:hypothetical protein
VWVQCQTSPKTSAPSSVPSLHSTEMNINGCYTVFRVRKKPTDNTGQEAVSYWLPWEVSLGAVHAMMVLEIDVDVLWMKSCEPSCDCEILTSLACLPVPRQCLLRWIDYVLHYTPAWSMRSFVTAKAYIFKFSTPGEGGRTEETHVKH